MASTEEVGQELPNNESRNKFAEIEALKVQMIQGYQEMAELNLQIAEEFFALENETELIE